jgi:hypothetical protein
MPCRLVALKLAKAASAWTLLLLQCLLELAAFDINVILDVGHLQTLCKEACSRLSLYCESHVGKL